MARSKRCAMCGQIATGLAFVNDARYCHGDDDTPPTCFLVLVRWLP